MSELAIGIDVGGTKIRGGIVDLGTGRVLHCDEVPTQATTDAITADIRAQIARLRAQAPAAIGIGIGLPELVTPDGRAASDWIMDWRAFDPASLTDHEIPTTLDSDVRCGARAELHFGAGRELRDFSYVSIGTGISAVHVFGGRIHYGAAGFAIHFGTSDLVSFTETGELRHFNLEANASGKGIAEQYAARGGAPLPTRTLFARPDDARAQAVLSDATLAMASYLGQMVNMLDPEALIIGGGLGLAPDYFARLSREIPPFIWAESRRSLPIVQVKVAENAGLIGAALNLSRA